MNILVFGNSITQGFYDTECGGWVNRLFIYTMRQGGHVVFNLGVSGEDIVGIADRLEREVESRVGRRERDMCIMLAVGVNGSQVDIKTGEHRTEPDVYEEKLRYVVAYAQENERRIVLVGLAPIDGSNLDPIPWHDTHAYRVTEVEKYNALIEKVAQENHIPFVSLRGIFGDDPGAYTTDGIHPNAEGHKLIYEQVKKCLEQEHIL